MRGLVLTWQEPISFVPNDQKCSTKFFESSILFFVKLRERFLRTLLVDVLIDIDLKINKNVRQKCSKEKLNF